MMFLVGSLSFTFNNLLFPFLALRLFFDRVLCFVLTASPAAQASSLIQACDSLAQLIFQ